MKITTDSIANFLTKIRNASRARRDTVIDTYSKLKESLANLMVARGFLDAVKIDRENKYPLLVVTLNPKKMDMMLKRMSKPGQRMYIPWQKIERVKSGLGIGIYSTSQGILPDHEARKLKIGGEYICKIS